MFAIIKTGGKQIKVSQGEEIFIEKIEKNEGEIVEFNEVLMIDNKFGTPFLTDALVVGTILKQAKQKKIVVFHYKPKKTQHKKYGHRQPYTKVRIDEILLSAKDRKVIDNKQEKIATSKDDKKVDEAMVKSIVKKTTSKTTAKPVVTKSDKKESASKTAASKIATSVKAKSTTKTNSKPKTVAKEKK